MADPRSPSDVLARLEAEFLALLRDPEKDAPAIEAFLGRALEAHPDLTEEILGLVAVAEALDLADVHEAERLAKDESPQDSPEVEDRSPPGGEAEARDRR